tara:strand:- start:1852 stop:2301 length:450 start_codon:yes stop_codon:yes gene_type:complete
VNEVDLLKLRATDEEDLAVISAILQDSVIAIDEMTFLQKECRFAFVANRFCWEDANRDRPLEGNIIYERVNCGICFDTVTAVRHNGLNQAKKTQIISLLSIVAEEDFIDLAFSAGITVRLQVEKIMCHIQDLDEPWPTQRRPSHPFGDN